MAKKKTKKTEKKEKDGQLAVIRVRGKINITAPVKKTMEMLHLFNKNWCSVLPDNDSVRGMISKVKDYITWGEISEKSLEKLVEKRGELFKGRTEDKKGKIKYDKFISFNKKKYKKYFRLAPPKKGYGRKGIKVAFSKGGALGYRGKEIEDLINRMI